MLINCVAYEDGRKLADLAVEAISDYLRRPGCFVWVALRDATDDELAQMQREFDLHELAVEDVRKGHQRPKLEEYGDAIFVVLRTAQRGADGAMAFGETHLFVGPGYVVSVRHGPSVPYVDVRNRCESAPHLLKKGPGFVLYALMDFVVDNYFPIVDALEEDLEKLEEEIYAEGEECGPTAHSRIRVLRSPVEVPVDWDRIRALITEDGPITPAVAAELIDRAKSPRAKVGVPLVA